MSNFCISTVLFCVLYMFRLKSQWKYNSFVSTHAPMPHSQLSMD